MSVQYIELFLKIQTNKYIWRGVHICSFSVNSVILFQSLNSLSSLFGQTLKTLIEMYSNHLTCTHLLFHLEPFCRPLYSPNSHVNTHTQFYSLKTVCSSSMVVCFFPSSRTSLSSLFRWWGQLPAEQEVSVRLPQTVITLPLQVGEDKGIVCVSVWVYMFWEELSWGQSSDLYGWINL